MNCCDYDCRQGRDCPARKLTEADLDARIADKAPAPAEACTELGAEDQTDSADREVAIYLLRHLAGPVLAVALIYAGVSLLP